MFITRFAPSPTGHLHIGHAYSALFAWRIAKRSGGQFLLRIEDIDHIRSRPEFQDSIFEDLEWIGIQWDKPVRLQSKYLTDYKKALAELADRDLLYPCFCTRKDIRKEIARASAAPHGPEGPIYPGICRNMNKSESDAKINNGESFALRLDVDKAADLAGPLTFIDHNVGRINVDLSIFGDIVLARKDVTASYHLAVTVDDALQGVTMVTRGEDLLSATHVHRLLQALLGLPEPQYYHHRMLTDDDGKRLAKRYGAVTLKSLRESGKTLADVRAMIEILSNRR